MQKSSRGSDMWECRVCGHDTYLTDFNNVSFCERCTTTFKNPVKFNNESSFDIRVKYVSDEVQRLSKIDVGNWIDLSCHEDVVMMKGEYKLISLGVSIELPLGYEANIVPRSGTFKKYKILQTNSYGVIDNSYCGNDDVWRFPVYATERTFIEKHSRLCQFRINKTQPSINFIEVDNLDGSNRGGFGSTGV